MNLMFWKKKTGAEEEAEEVRENLAVSTKPREPLDFVAAKPDIAAHNPEPSVQGSLDADETSLEAPAKQGLFARMKLRLGALAQRFGKPKAFRAGEGQPPDAPDDTKEPENDAGMEPDLEQAELEAPSKPGLTVRIKLQIIALVRRFRKAPAPDADEEHGGDTEESGEPSEPATPAKPGLFMRIKAAFAAFIRELKAPVAPEAGEDEEGRARDRSEAAPEGEQPVGEPAHEPVRSRKWLVVGGSITIVVLLLIDIGLTIWPLLEPPQKRWGTKHNITSISSRPVRPEYTHDSSQAPAPEKSQAEVEALMKENAELQARIEALKYKKESPQLRPYAPTGRQPAASAPPSPASGDLVVGGKEPKATAMSLKEAIEAMNAGAGDYDKKPAK